MLLRHPSICDNVLSHFETYHFWKLIIILCYFFGTDFLSRQHMTPWNIGEFFPLLDMLRFGKLQLCWTRTQNNATSLSIFPSNSYLLKIAFWITWFQEILKELCFPANTSDIFFFKWVSKAFGGSSRCGSQLSLSKKEKDPFVLACRLFTLLEIRLHNGFVKENISLLWNPCKINMTLSFSPFLCCSIYSESFMHHI